jgi:hypothetical protein
LRKVETQVVHAFPQHVVDGFGEMVRPVTIQTAGDFQHHFVGPLLSNYFHSACHVLSPCHAGVPAAFFIA